MTGEAKEASRSRRAWAEHACAGWIALVLAVWWVHFHATGIGEYRKLERRVPALATFREALDALFYRESVF